MNKSITRLPARKFCCDGLNTHMITPIKSIKKDGIFWRRAIYCCSRCHEYTIRGETDKCAHNTMVEIITKDEANSLLNEKKVFIERMKGKI